MLKLVLGVLFVPTALAYLGALVWRLVAEASCHQFALCKNVASIAENPDKTGVIAVTFCALVCLWIGLGFIRDVIRRGFE